MLALLKTPRGGFSAIFAICLGLIVFGLWLQHSQGLEPCPLCILQRYAFVLAGIIALAGALHGPAGVARRIYGLLLVVTALAGASVAGRQSWLQHFPPKFTECGADFDFMLGNFSLGDALPMIFRGTGDCSKVQWTFVGLSIPEWALIWFAVIAVVAAMQLFRGTPTTR